MYMEVVSQLMKAMELKGLARVALVGSYGTSSKAKDVDLLGLVSEKAEKSLFRKRLLEVVGQVGELGILLTGAKGGWRSDEEFMKTERLDSLTDPLDYRATRALGWERKLNEVRVNDAKGLEWLIESKWDELQVTGLKVDFYVYALHKQASVLYRWREPSFEENARSLERDFVYQATSGNWYKAGKRLISLSKHLGHERLAAALEPLRGMSDVEALEWLWKRRRELPPRWGEVVAKWANLDRLPAYCVFW